jgi:hypothetical protein
MAINYGQPITDGHWAQLPLDLSPFSRRSVQAPRKKHQVSLDRILQFDYQSSRLFRAMVQIDEFLRLHQ